MDYLKKMESARESVKSAYLNLLSVDGLDSILDDLTKVYLDLNLEIAEYKSHTETSKGE